MNKEIYDLELHETVSVSGNVEVMRVHDGFLYTTRIEYLECATSVFVPFNETKEITRG